MATGKRRRLVVAGHDVDSFGSVHRFEDLAREGRYFRQIDHGRFELRVGAGQKRRVGSRTAPDVEETLAIR